MGGFGTDYGGAFWGGFAGDLGSVVLAFIIL